MEITIRAGNDTMIGQWLRSKLRPEERPCGTACESQSHEELIQQTYSTINSLAEKRQRVHEELEKTHHANMADALLRARDRMIQP